MKKYLGNAFSLQMLTDDHMIINVSPVDPTAIPEDAVSVIGHADTAAVVSNILGRKVEMNRASIKLAPGDELYVAQLTGGRLPEGATTIPEGMEISFLRVRTFRKECAGCPGVNANSCGWCGQFVGVMF